MPPLCAPGGAVVPGSAPPACSLTPTDGQPLITKSKQNKQGTVLSRSHTPPCPACPGARGTVSVQIKSPLRVAFWRRRLAADPARPGLWGTARASRASAAQRATRNRARFRGNDHGVEAAARARQHGAHHRGARRSSLCDFGDLYRCSPPLLRARTHTHCAKTHRLPQNVHKTDME